MSRLKDFIVNITLDTALEVRETFGNILLITSDVDHVYKVYYSLEEVAVDFEKTTDTYKMAAALFPQSPGPTQLAIVGVETLLPAEITGKLEETINEDWMAFICTDNADETITALSTWAVANEKYYAATTQNLSLFSTITDDNTLLQFHDSADMHLAEAMLIYMLVRPVGSTTAKFKQLVGINEAKITDTELAILHEENGGTYIKDMGLLQTTNSKAQGGEYFDVILSQAWIKLEMEKGLRTLAMNVGKIPYTNAGIAMLISVAETTLKKAAQNGIILIDDNDNPVYEIKSVRREEVAQTDRAARKYNSITWTASLAGAIEKCTISGTLTV